ncbi:hypothetical protein WN944_003540 [Citrus x changshan-huyou]|uniref:Uncharacterized protein n=1 Tax=Citrus x changshan-huyou TaxID=2935761 RepID=A0AAP0M1L2_9ROSI
MTFKPPPSAPQEPPRLSFTYSLMITAVQTAQEDLPITGFNSEGYPVYPAKYNGHFLWDAPGSGMCDPNCPCFHCFPEYHRIELTAGDVHHGNLKKARYHQCKSMHDAKWRSEGSMPSCQKPDLELQSVAAVARSRLLLLMSSLGLCSNYFQSIAAAAALPVRCYYCSISAVAAAVFTWYLLQLLPISAVTSAVLVFAPATSSPLLLPLLFQSVAAAARSRLLQLLSSLSLCSSYFQSVAAAAARSRLLQLLSSLGICSSYFQSVAAAARSWLLQLLSSLGICSSYFQSVAAAAALPVRCCCC